MATARSKELMCSLIEDGGLILEKKAGSNPYYTGLVTSADTLMVVDWIARNLQLYSRHDGKLLATSDRLESDPRGVCLISNTEVSVILRNSKIVILSFKSIDDVKRVKTLDLTTVFDECYAVAKVKSTDKVVVSGYKQGMTCWCVVSITDGHVETIHTICKGGGYRSHLAIKNNTVYISCPSDDSTVRGVYAYDIFNPHKQKFLYQHRELSTPCGLTVDTRGFIFVCDFNSNSIHQLTERGELVTIHSVSSRPCEIFYEDQHGVLYTTRWGSNVITRYRLQYLHQPGIPIEILNMDDRSIQLFEEALKDGKETVCSIRVMVVGHAGVGKTTLIKRLLGEKVNISKRQSTEGINVYVNCCDVSLSTCEWTRRIKDSEQDYQLQRLARVLNEQHSTKDKVADFEQVLILPQGETTDSDASVTDKKQVLIPLKGERTLKSHEGAYVAVEDKNTEVIYRRSPQQDFGQDLSSTAGQQEESPSTLFQRKLAQSETNTVAMLKSLQENAYKLKEDAGKTSPLTVYDFAGQYAFYTTHQTFLTRRAIYLLVSDVSEQLTDLVVDECYFDSEGIMKCKVHELIEVWVNSIHSCAPFPEASTPPVILVGTHVDKISQKQSPAKGIESETQTTTLETAEFTLPTTSTYAATTSKEQPKASTVLGTVQKFFKPRKTKGIVDATPVSSMAGAHALPTVDQPKAQRKWRFWERILEKKRMRTEAKKRYRHQICERYFRDIRTCLKDKPTRFHLVDEDFAIDNTVVDSRLEDLKRKIVEVASQQPYWEEKIPARWLPLEQELMRLKAAGIKVILRGVLEDLNQTGAVPIATEELDLFLRFQHDIGTILYFSMDVLREKIVLDPQWLIDALKSLITADEMFILRNTKAVSNKWYEFKTKGKLSPELIDAIWTKKKRLDFHENKEHLLHLMEKLNIIAKPRSYSEDGQEIKEEDYYLAPCMLRQAVPKQIISPASRPDMESASVLAFVCTGMFLPPPIFHRLVGACLTRWPIAKQKSENLIYCGCCVFDIDHHHRLTLHSRDYVIFAQVTRMGATDMTQSSELCSRARKFIFENLSKITGNLGQSLQFEPHIKCPDSDADSLESLIAVSLLQQNEKVVCHSHDKSHTLISRELLQFWFLEEGGQGEKGGDTENTDIQDQTLSQVYDVRARAMNIPTQLYQSKGVSCSDPKLLCQILNKSQQAASSSRSTLEGNCLSVGLELYGETPSNGNCFFEAVSSQLQRLNCVVQKSPQQLRQEVVAFMKTNRVLHAAEGTINLADFIEDETFEDYCTRMARDEEWADHVVVVAMARKLQIDIMIITSSPSSGPDDIIVWVIGQTNFQGKPILLGHIYEYHYESLQPIGDNKVQEVLGSDKRIQPTSEETSTQTEQEDNEASAQRQGTKGKASSLSEENEDENSVVPDDPITQEHINHARLCNALTTVCADALRKILLTQVPTPHTNIYQAILANHANLTSRRQVRPGQSQTALLNKDQSQLVFPGPVVRYTGTVEQFDISLLYIIIRNVSSVPASATGWGNPPTDQPRDSSWGECGENSFIQE